MQCPVCQHEMSKSVLGWLCGNCGHVEPIVTDGTKTPIKVPQDSGISNVAPPTPIIGAPGSDVPPPPPGMQTSPLSVSTVAAFNPDGPSKKKLIIIGLLVLLGLLLIAGGIMAYQTFVLAPKKAPVAYLQTLANAKTAHFGVNASATGTKGQSDGGLIDGQGSITAIGTYNLTSPKQPAVNAKLNLKYGSGSVGGEVTVVSQTAYLKLEQTDLFKSLGLTFSTGWYKIPVSQGASQPGLCQVKNAKTGTLLGVPVPTNSPFVNTKRAGTATIDGHKVVHYTGDLDMTKLQAIVNQANGGLPESCQIKLDPNHVKGTTVRYDLWHGADYDHMVVKVSDAVAQTNATVTLDTSQYNQPVTIKAPTGAKSLNDVLQTIGAGAREDTPGQ